MVNYDNLPLFPLQVVLYPDMTLPLHIFEPRYREMIRQCREQNWVFGVLLDQNDGGARATEPGAIGTTARLTQLDVLHDGRMNIEVLGETRFKVVRTTQQTPYLSAKVEPFWEEMSDPTLLKSEFDAITELFKTYLKSHFARSNRSLSAVHLPREPEYLSYAVASFLQISLKEKQELLQMTNTQRRLRREIEILNKEIDAYSAWDRVEALNIFGDSRLNVMPVDTEALRKLSSLN